MSNTLLSSSLNIPELFGADEVFSAFAVVSSVLCKVSSSDFSFVVVRDSLLSPRHSTLDSRVAFESEHDPVSEPLRMPESDPHRLLPSKPHRLLPSEPHRLLASELHNVLVSEPHRMPESSEPRLVISSQRGFDGAETGLEVSFEVVEDDVEDRIEVTTVSHSGLGVISTSGIR